MKTNFSPPPNTDLATNPAANPKAQAPLPTWRAPTITRIEIKRTMNGGASGSDGNGRPSI
jgi:hypothetical protein